MYINHINSFLVSSLIAEEDKSEQISYLEHAIKNTHLLCTPRTLRSLWLDLRTLPVVQSFPTVAVSAIPIFTTIIIVRAISNNIKVIISVQKQFVHRKVQEEEKRDSVYCPQNIPFVDEGSTFPSQQFTTYINCAALQDVTSARTESSTGNWYSPVLV